MESFPRDVWVMALCKLLPIWINKKHWEAASLTSCAHSRAHTCEITEQTHTHTHKRHMKETTSPFKTDNHSENITSAEFVNQEVSQHREGAVLPGQREREEVMERTRNPQCLEPRTGPLSFIKLSVIIHSVYNNHSKPSRRPHWNDSLSLSDKLSDVCLSVCLSVSSVSVLWSALHIHKLISAFYSTSSQEPSCQKSWTPKSIWSQHTVHLEPRRRQGCVLFFLNTHVFDKLHMRFIICLF